jgi:dolichol-phosphate mannosyltransferase
MISVVVPARNERENVLEIIPQIHEHLGPIDHEILLVDDGTDGAADAVTALDLPFVRTFRRKEGKGLGSAVGYGLAQAAGDVIVVMDSDFNHQPKYIPRLLKGLVYADCVCGSRFLKEGVSTGMHHVLSRAFNRFVRSVTKGELSDYSYGFLAFKKECLARLDAGRIFRGHGDYAIRFLFYLEKNGAKVLELPVVNGRRLFGEPNRAYVFNFFRYVSEVFKLASAKEQVKLARQSV